MLVDGVTGELVPRAPELLDVIGDSTDLERYTVTGELLTNTLEVTSGVGATVAEAVDDIADAVAAVRAVADPRGIELMSKPIDQARLLTVLSRGGDGNVQALTR